MPLRFDEPTFAELLLRRAFGQVRQTHVARVLSSKFYRPRPEIEKFRGVGKGRRCFVVGNGPSLNKIDLDLLAAEHSFCVNGIFLKFPETKFRPTYYCVEDCLVAEDRAPEINALEGFEKFFPWGYRDVLVPGPRVNYLNFMIDYTEYRNFPEFGRDAARCVWVGGTVTYICLQLAYYMGYDPVYLVGIDHSYAVDPSKNVVQGARMTSKADDENHFHKDYFGKGYRWHDPRVDRMEMAYHRARKEFERDRRRVLNATVGGKLEVFPRVEFSTLVGTKG